MLIDSFGRVLDYLRVSVTGRCNFRCVYCMPPEGVERQPHEAILRFEEILRLCRVLADLGIRRIRVTGGEPLVRRGIVSFIRDIKTVPGIEQVTLTTNGALLGRYLDEIAAVPLSGINVSLDSLNTETFRRITRCAIAEDRSAGTASPAAILKTIERARSLGIPVKVNCVPLRNVNERELADIAALAERTVDAVRFIELMPIGCAGELEPIPGGEVRSILEGCSLSLRPTAEKPGSGPAVYFAVPGFSGRIGFINPVSQGFCGTCNRLRLTSEGILKPCLSSDSALDLRALLRSGAPDSRIAEAVTRIVAMKPANHSFSAVYGGRREDHKGKAMFRIGG
ncbi:MAG: GTP 3',8-cyclase MoaA [Treponema sp.]|jgi:cyclic pyranopterin phosphate synthase|nr:GTP 3',8-cyclase MoaA [Treponema sp.]